ncbi:branched-chain amino acid ABC transporter permease [Paenarthrobacter sp. NPDC092416]|uniref:branched-chain amino acid ABC transporter permease n=1 Tax=Paenarthrobacter sp. NPDC092416 TaxID=3364386 RepID=UPI0037FF2369
MISLGTIKRFGTWPLLLVGAALLPYVVVSGSARLLAATALIYALLAASWNLTLGIGGIFNFAHIGFFGVGGYTMAVSTVTWDVNPWLGLVLASAAGGLAGALAYIPVIRMRGIYIALITFVFVQLCYYLVLAIPGITGGSSGLTGVPALSIGEFSFAKYSGLGYLWLLGVAVVMLLVVLKIILRSSFGKSLIALRDNEHLAVSRGMNRVRQHLLAFILSGAVAGVTGALYVAYFRVADVTLFSFGFVTLGLSMIFLGGTGHIWGPVLGALIVTVIDRQLTDLGPMRAILIGVGTLLVLVFLPRGISGLIGDVWNGARRLLRRSGNHAHRTSDQYSDDKEAAHVR